MDVKTVRMAAMGLTMFAMVGWMAWDMSAPSTALIHDEVTAQPSLNTSLDEERNSDVELASDSTQVTLGEVIINDEAIDQPSSSTSLDEERNSDVELASALTQVTPGEVIIDDDVIDQPNLSTPPFTTFTLSNKAQAMLNAFEDTALSKVEEARMQAKLKAQTTQKAYFETMTPKTDPPSPPVNDPNASIIDLIEVKSIIATPARTTAWVSLQGQTLSVQQHANIQGVRVVDIQPGAIQFKDAKGRLHTKFVAAIVTKKEEEHDKRTR